MSTYGRRVDRLSAVVAGGAFGVAACTLALVLWSGFSVDDAWIVTRVVSHGLASGRFSFNPEGPVTDAITPLGFERLVAAAVRVTGASTFAVQRAIGFAATLVAAFSIGARLVLVRGRELTPHVVFGGALVSSIPLAAWAGAGLETGLVGLLVLAGLWLAERPDRASFVGALLTGLAFAWRPELTPALGFAWFSIVRERPGTWRARFFEATLLVAPALAIVAVRWHAFGTIVPLSSIAKAPSFASGIHYALAATLGTGVLASLGSVAWQTRRSVTASKASLGLRVLVVHLVALVFAGGDWMPFFRLVAPLLPWLLWLLAVRAEATLATWLGLALHVASHLGSATWNEDARRVIETRRGWIEAARPLLRDASVVASVDIGWVGQAFSGTVVDLAGVTDPRIAPLAGGHTSKWVAPGLFAHRDVDTWIVRVERETAADRTTPASILELRPVYVVDRRLLRGAESLGFREVGRFPLARTTHDYVVLRAEARP